MANVKNNETNQTTPQKNNYCCKAIKTFITKIGTCFCDITTCFSENQHYTPAGSGEGTEF